MAETMSKRPSKATGSTTKKPKVNKGAKVIELIQQPEGASMSKLIKVTGWQAHTIRAVISVARKKEGLTVELKDGVYRAV